MEYPGVDKNIFYLKLSKDWIRKGDILSTSSSKVFVIKVYKLTLWRKFICFLNNHYDLNIKIRLGQLKVKTI